MAPLESSFTRCSFYPVSFVRPLLMSFFSFASPPLCPRTLLRAPLALPAAAACRSSDPTALRLPWRSAAPRALRLLPGLRAHLCRAHAAPAGGIWTLQAPLCNQNGCRVKYITNFTWNLIGPNTEHISIFSALINHKYIYFMILFSIIATFSVTNETFKIFESC